MGWGYRERAHPRSRGENQGDAYTCVGELGSSPLTRGKLNLPLPSRRSIRLIPAHAGKTADRMANRIYAEAHPRSRGENSSAALASMDACGSSPLTRGKRERAGLLTRPRGLIPAHAGKTRR